MAAYERQLRAQQRIEEIQAVIALDEELMRLCQMHQDEFLPATPARASQPEPVDAKAIRKERERDALVDIPRFAFAERKAAKRAIADDLEAAVEVDAAQRQEETNAVQRQLDDAWEALNKNDPQLVLELLEEAFADNEMPAAAVSCHGDRADVVMRWPTVDEVVPERKAAVTPSGRSTIKKKTKTELAEYYLWAMASNALVTAKEAFAVAPAVNQVGLAVVRTVSDAARGDEIVEPVFLGTVQRSQLDGIRWADVKPIATLLELCEGRIGMKGRGTNKTLFGLDVSDPEEKDFLESVGSALRRRVPDSGVKGIDLPVSVVQAG